MFRLRLPHCVSMATKVASLCKYGDNGGMTLARGSVVNGVLSVPGPLISIIAFSVSNLLIFVESVTSSHPVSSLFGIRILHSGSDAFGLR